MIAASTRLGAEVLVNDLGRNVAERPVAENKVESPNVAVDAHLLKYGSK